MVTVRPMTAVDVPGAVNAWAKGFLAMRAKYGLPLTPKTLRDDRRLENRIRHFLQTDPRGSWVAESDGAIVGLSQSFVRESHWVLSLLATVPGSQGRGLGRELLEMALSIASPDSPGTIQCSRDPAAMALYANSGFSLNPSVVGWGRVRAGAVNADPRVQPSDLSALSLVGGIDRAVRGSARGIDIEAMLREEGNRLLVIEDRGYAVARDDRVVTLGALDEDAARALLRTALAGAGPQDTVEINWLTANQQWAITTLIAAGVELRPSGPMMVRGMPGPPAPCIPSGGYG